MKLISFFIFTDMQKLNRFTHAINRDMSDKLIAAKERMKQFERDVCCWINYDYVIINDEFANLL